MLTLFHHIQAEEGEAYLSCMMSKRQRQNPEDETEDKLSYNTAYMQVSTSGKCVYLHYLHYLQVAYGSST